MTGEPKQAIDGDWFEFAFDGKDYSVEIGETLYFLTKIDRAHEDDLNECLDCRESFAMTPEMRAADPDDRVCPACGSKSIDWNEAYLDDVSEHLTKRVGMPRCSRTEARRFYFAIVEAYAAKKKTSSTSADSPTSTESTRADSAN